MSDETGALLDALVTTWPVVGREALIARVLDRLETGNGGVVLTGAPGVGKSRIGRRVVAEATARGFATEWVQATDATRDIPLGPFVPVLPKDAAESETPLQLLRRATAALLDRAKRRPLLLAVDDGHLLDPASATLVQQVATADDAFVIVTTRTGESVPDAIVALWKDGLADRIDVGPLEQREVGTILRAALLEDVESATVRRLWAATGGNALFLHELVLAGLRSGALARADSGWRWRGPLTGDGDLRAVLEARLAPISLEEREALDLLAIGEPLGVDVFEQLVGVQVVDRLEREELMTVRRAERREEASLVHPLYRDVLRDAMPPSTTASIRARLAHAVEEAGGRRRGDLLRVALWRLGASGDHDPALLLAAAAEAESRFDARLAERLARAAVDADGGADAWHGLASALRSQGRCLEADDAWARALEMETDGARRVAIAQARSANLFFGLGEGALAITVLDRVIADASTPELRDNIAALVAMYDLYRGRIDAALAASVPILERGGVRADARIDAALTAASALALRGRPREAIAIADDNIAIALQNPDVGSIAAGAVMATRILALLMDGQFHDAQVAAQVVYELAVDMGTNDGIAGLAFALGQLHQTTGDIEASRRLLTESVVLLREHDRNGYLPWALAELAYTEIVAGDLPRAVHALEELDEVTHEELRLFQPRVEVARLLLVAAEGDTPTAIAGLAAAADAAVADGHLVLGAMAMHEAVRFGGAWRVADSLGRLAIATDSGLVRAFAQHARAAANDDGAALDQASIVFEAVGALPAAADASAAAAGAHARVDANAERVAAEQRTAALLERCPGAAPPWMSRPTTATPLTEREREVAELAAQGHSSREIADRLFLSVRTVDNHLYRSYAKLGLDSREELAIVLGVRRRG